MVPRQGCRGSEPETWMSNVRVPYRLTVRALVEKHMQRAYLSCRSRFLSYFHKFNFYTMLMRIIRIRREVDADLEQIPVQIDLKLSALRFHKILRNRKPQSASFRAAHRHAQNAPSAHPPQYSMAVRKYS